MADRHLGCMLLAVRSCPQWKETHCHVSNTCPSCAEESCLSFSQTLTKCDPAHRHWLNMNSKVLFPHSQTPIILSSAPQACLPSFSPSQLKSSCQRELPRSPQWAGAICPMPHDHPGFFSPCSWFFCDIFGSCPTWKFLKGSGYCFLCDTPSAYKRIYTSWVSFTLFHQVC